MTSHQIKEILIEKLNKLIIVDSESEREKIITDYKETVRRIFTDHPSDTVDAIILISTELKNHNRLRSLYET